MKRVLLVILLVFLAAAHSTAAGLPDVERSRSSGLNQSAQFDGTALQRAGDVIEKCCVKELIEQTSPPAPCSTDCTYLLTDVEVLFPGCPETHDPQDHAWGAPISCSTLLRPPIA